MAEVQPVLCGISFLLKRPLGTLKVLLDLNIEMTRNGFCETSAISQFIYLFILFFISQHYRLVFFGLQLISIGFYVLSSFPVSRLLNR